MGEQWAPHTVHEMGTAHQAKGLANIKEAQP